MINIDKLRYHRDGEEVPPSLWMMDRAVIDKRIREARNEGMSLMDYSSTDLFLNRAGHYEDDIGRPISKVYSIPISMTKKEYDYLTMMADAFGLTINQLVSAVIKSEVRKGMPYGQDV